MRELPVRKPNRLQNYDYSQNGAYFVTMCIKDRHEILGNIVGTSVVGATVPGRPLARITTPYARTTTSHTGIINPHTGISTPHTGTTTPYMELSDIGKIVDEAIKYYIENIDGIVFDKYVIMPNHIHAIIVILPKTESGDRGSQTGNQESEMGGHEPKTGGHGSETGGHGSETGDRGRSPLQYIVRNLKSYVTKKIGFSPWQKSFHDHIIRNEQDYNRIAEYIENNPASWHKDCFFAGSNKG